MARAAWMVSPGSVNVKTPPIAGLDGVPAANGLTTLIAYDPRLDDGVAFTFLGWQHYDSLHRQPDQQAR